MLDPFIGEILAVPYNFAPRNWAFCHGQLLPINQNQALFSLLGTTYGGNGQTNFALPDLRGRVPISSGQGPGLADYPLGTQGGATAVTLATSELPAHGHAVNAAGNPLSPSPVSNLPAVQKVRNAYGPSSAAALDADTISAMGGSQAHNNIQPYLCINYVIALQGTFPPHN